MTTATLAPTVPFNRRERIKDIPHNVKDTTVKGANTVKDATAKAFDKAIEIVVAGWNKLPRTLQFVFGVTAAAAVIYAWCLGIAMAIFGIFGYTYWTLVLYYAVAVGVPVGLLMSMD